MISEVAVIRICTESRLSYISVMLSSNFSITTPVPMGLIDPTTPHIIGGYYHRKTALELNHDYRLNALAIYIMKPNRCRYKTNIGLGLSVSGFEQESWNPAWSNSAILSGLGFHTFYEIK